MICISAVVKVDKGCLLAQAMPATAANPLLLGATRPQLRPLTLPAGHHQLLAHFCSLPRASRLAREATPLCAFSWSRSEGGRNMDTAVNSVGSLHLLEWNGIDRGKGCVSELAGGEEGWLWTQRARCAL